MADSVSPPRAYAYHVPLNPYEPHEGQWATLVRREPVRVGDRIDVPVHETVASSAGASSEVVIRGSAHHWEVVAIKPIVDAGRRAGVRGFKGPDPIWAGLLELRPV